MAMAPVVLAGSLRLTSNVKYKVVFPIHTIAEISMIAIVAAHIPVTGAVPASGIHLICRGVYLPSPYLATIRLLGVHLPVIRAHGLVMHVYITSVRLVVQVEN